MDGLFHGKSQNGWFIMENPSINGSSWRFPDIGVVPNHPFSMCFFHYKSSIWGFPLIVDTSIETYHFWEWLNNHTSSWNHGDDLGMVSEIRFAMVCHISEAVGERISWLGNPTLKSNQETKWWTTQHQPDPAVPRMLRFLGDLMISGLGTVDISRPSALEADGNLSL